MFVVPASSEAEAGGSFETREASLGGTVKYCHTHTHSVRNIEPAAFEN